jgi:hypothetical protein
MSHLLLFYATNHFEQLEKDWQSLINELTGDGRAARSCQARWRTARKRRIMRAVVDPRGRECRLKRTSS